MRWGAIAAVLGALFLLVGCGGPGENVEEADVTAGIHAEEVEAEWMLAEVEADQAGLKAGRADIAKEPDGVSRADHEDERIDRRDLVRARRISRRCNEGDGLEQCPRYEGIDAVVKEMGEEFAEPVTAP